VQIRLLFTFRLIIVALCSVVLFGCVQLKAVNTDQRVFATYKNYSSLLNDENQYSNAQLEEIFAFYSSRYQKEILNTRKQSPEVLQHLIENYLSFPLLLKHKINHFEKISSEQACLIINAKSLENEKIAFYISFIKLDKWLIDAVAVEHLANYNQYFTEANCSKGFRDDLRFKEMMEQ